MTDETVETPAEEPQHPALRIITPDATPEEIAAIVAVFSAMGGAPAPVKKPVPGWSARHRAMRPALPHGHGGWRASGLPR